MATTRRLAGAAAAAALAALAASCTTVTVEEREPGGGAPAEATTTSTPGGEEAAAHAVERPEEPGSPLTSEEADVVAEIEDLGVDTKPLAAEIAAAAHASCAGDDAAVRAAAGLIAVHAGGGDADPEEIAAALADAAEQHLCASGDGGEADAEG